MKTKQIHEKGGILNSPDNERNLLFFLLVVLILK